jgi:hypothetical protein
MVLFVVGNIIKVALLEQLNLIMTNSFLSTVSIKKFTLWPGMELIKLFIVVKRMETFICGA